MSGEGAQPPPQTPPPVGRGTPPPHTPPLSAPAFGASILGAYGASILGAFGAAILAPSVLGVPVLFQLQFEPCIQHNVML